MLVSPIWLTPSSIPALATATSPATVLISARLNTELVVKRTMSIHVRIFGDMVGCVVTQQDQLRPAQTQYTVRLRPASIIADAQPDLAAAEVEDVKAEVANVKIPLLQVLETDSRVDAPRVLGK